MYIIKDAEGDERGACWYSTADAALEGLATEVAYTLDRPQEFPFSIIDTETGKPVLVLNLPTQE